MIPDALCPVCGAPHATCGRGASATPVDQLTTLPKGDPVTKKYRTTVNGLETILKLNDDDAKTYRNMHPDEELTAVPDSTSDNQAETPDVYADNVQTKARTAPANKARTTQTGKA